MRILIENAVGSESFHCKLYRTTKMNYCITFCVLLFPCLSFVYLCLLLFK